jgi:CheY-like chemotaxis protein
MQLRLSSVSVGEALNASAFAAGRVMRRRRRLNILIVEDEPLLALDLQQVLHRLRHRVAGVARGQSAALELARAEAPDLAIVDIILAEGCGVTAAQRMLDDLGIPSIFLTSYGDYETRQWARDADPLAFLPKPVCELQLARALRGAGLI